MLASLVVRVAGYCTYHRRLVIAAAAIIALAATAFAAVHFKINTDTERLLPSDMPWQQRQRAYAQLFPPHQLLAVVDAPTPELAELAGDRLTERLRRQPDLFPNIARPAGGALMARDALLYQPIDQVRQTLHQLEAIRPALAIFAADPSLRGVMHVVSTGVDAVQSRRLPAEALVKPLNALSDTLDPLLAGKFASLSGRAFLGPQQSGAAAEQLIEIDPKLDFNALQPAHAATEAIRNAAADLHLRQDFGATVRLTGQAAINDAQFSALGESAIPGLIGTILAVLAILWLGLRSLRIIGPVLLTLAAGFVVTTAAGLLLVGAFNLLSVAFAVLFIGLGADFAIQYSVRYRAERHARDDVLQAIPGAARRAGGPLALAAASTAIGFFSFLPTQYRGIAELGEIAGIGMLVAFIGTITLLPALLATFRPPSEAEAMGFTVLAPIDRFLAQHRIGIVVGTLAVVIAGLPLLAWMRFDFDPIHLQNQNSEAVETYHRLRRNPELGIDAIDVLAPSVASIDGVAKRFAAVPEIAGTRSVLNLIPPDQDAKLDAIRHAEAMLAAALDAAPAAAPSDSDDAAAAVEAAADLQALSHTAGGDAAAAATRLARLIGRVADGDAALRRRAEAAIVTPLRYDLDQIRAMLRPQRITVATLPRDIASDWVAANGQARIELLPRGDTGKTATLQEFAKAALAVTPGAVGSPISLYEAKRIVLEAFFEAGALAIVSIALVLWIVLRRLGDVLLTLVPLLVAAAVTLELMAVLGQPINFANVIALPLLLGVGVAFKIYYVMAWREGRTNLLQSTLTRAVLFSAMTTATAFGSLWLSSQPGMSSMGRLMALALVCTLSAAVLFQPALMGPPRAGRSAPPRQSHPEGVAAPTLRETPPAGRVFPDKTGADAQERNAPPRPQMRRAGGGRG